MSGIVVAEQFRDAQQQMQTRRFGLWLFLANEILFFGTAIIGYAYACAHHPLGFAEASRRTDIGLGSAETAILIVSAGTMSYAVQALRTGARRMAIVLMYFTALLGLVFLVLHGKEYIDEFGEHLVPGSPAFPFSNPANGSALFFYSYYALTAFHGLHVAVGILLLVWFAARIQQERGLDRWLPPVALTAIYWHFVDLVWLFLFPLIYLVSRS
jgi:cytochrome c oxidase subunit 3